MECYASKEFVISIVETHECTGNMIYENWDTGEVKEIPFDKTYLDKVLEKENCITFEIIKDLLFYFYIRYKKEDCGKRKGEQVNLFLRSNRNHEGSY